MSWFRREHTTEIHTVRTDSAAEAAKQRAREALEEAQRRAEEMHAVTGRIRDQRIENHFAAAIYGSMKGRHPREP